MTEKYMTPDETDRYIDERVDKRLQQPKRGILRRVGRAISTIITFILIALVILVFAFVARFQFGVPIPLPAGLAGTASVTYSTSVAPLASPIPFGGGVAQPFRGDGVQQPPVVQGAAPWPTLTPTMTHPTLTIPPVPTPTEGFWTPAEQTQISATATAFIEAVPTAPPAFVQYTEAQCNDPEVVAQSPFLQLICKR